MNIRSATTVSLQGYYSKLTPYRFAFTSVAGIING